MKALLQVGLRGRVPAPLEKRFLINAIHAHPTFSEAWMEAAHVLHGGAIHLSPPCRR
jgi:hypothetical protein